MAGGWSCHGQPIDQIHGVFRKLIRARDIVSTGMFSDLRSRPTYHEVDLKASGQLNYKVKPWADVIKLTWDAWCAMEPRVFEAAWLTTGLVPNDHFSRLNPANGLSESSGHVNLSLEEAKDVLSDIFIEMGYGHTPQRCTQFEWQLEDWPFVSIPLLT